MVTKGVASQISYTQRPVRLAVVIPSTSEKFLEYVGYYSSMCGGIRNFILPVRDDLFLPEPWNEVVNGDIIDLLHVDETLSKTAADYGVLRHWPHIHGGLTQTNGGRWRLSFLDVLWQLELWSDVPPERRKQRKFVRPYLDEPASNLLSAAAWGIFPSGMKPNLQAAWTELAKPLTAEPVQAELLAKSHDFIFGPIQFTEAFLEEETNAQIRPPGTIFIGDPASVSDLCEFWNIRALGHKVVFLSVAEVLDEKFPRVDHATMRREFLDQWGGSPSVVSCTLATSLPGPRTAEAQVVTSAIKRAFGTTKFDTPIFSYANFVSYPNAIRSKIHSCTVMAAETESSSDILPISRLDSESAFQIYVSEVDRSRSILASTDEFATLPSISWVAERALSRRLRLYPHYQFISNGKLCRFDQFHDLSWSIPHIRTLDVLSAFAVGKGSELAVSPAGMLADSILEYVGGLGSCRFLKIPGVRHLLAVANGDEPAARARDEVFTKYPPDHTKLLGPSGVDIAATKAYFDLLVRQYHVRQVAETLRGVQEPEAVKYLTTDLRYIQDLHLSPDVKGGHQSRVISFLVEKNVLAPGFNVRCEFGHECWYSLKDVEAKIICRQCGAEVTIRHKKDLTWAYSTRGPFRARHNASGGIPVLLALWRLAELVRRITFATSFSIKRGGNAVFEIDFAAFVESPGGRFDGLILGEAKTTRFESKDLEKMLKAASFFQEFDPLICLATLQREFSVAEKVAIKSLIEKAKETGTHVLTFLRDQLEAYSLHEVGLEEHGLQDLAVELAAKNLGD